jgi:hypothetical protein
MLAFTLERRRHRWPRQSNGVLYANRVTPETTAGVPQAMPELSLMRNLLLKLGQECGLR